MFKPFVEHRLPFITVWPSGRNVIPVVEIHDFIEQESSARSASESGADQFVAVGQIGVARGARVQSIAANVIEEYPTHGWPNGVPEDCAEKKKTKTVLKRNKRKTVGDLAGGQ